MSDNYTSKDFVDVIDEHGVISSVPSSWLKAEGKHLLPEGTKKATEANVRAAKAKSAAREGEPVDVDQIRADIEASLREEHDAALAEPDVGDGKKGDADSK